MEEKIENKEKPATWWEIILGLIGIIAFFLWVAGLFGNHQQTGSISDFYKCKEIINTSADSWDASTNTYTCQTNSYEKVCLRVERATNGDCLKGWEYNTTATSPVSNQ